jgi:VWFA-related protein
MPRRLKVGVRAWLGCCVGLALALGDGRPTRAQSGAPERTFSDRAEVSSVLVPVTVKDRRGRLVPTLEKQSFRLYVDGIEFPFASFWREAGLPLSIAFVLDSSGSMGGRRLSRAREVILEFLRQRGPEDEVCLITFGAGEVKRRLKFGTDPGQLPRILEALRGYGTTALYDMVAAAPQVMDGATRIRRVVILFTDGVDTASQLTAADAVRVLEGLNDPLYVFGIEPPAEAEDLQETYEELLKRFAVASGGRYIRVSNVSQLPALGRELRQELTLRYILGFTPSGVGASKWRTIEVRVDGAHEVQARHGYRGTLP